MRIRSRSLGSLLLFCVLPPTRLPAQQYCASGAVTESHTSDLKVGDPVILTARVESGTQSCRTFAERTECTAVVQLDIQSGKQHWSGASLQSKAASIAFTFFPRHTTTRIVLGGVVAPASSPQALSPFNIVGVHLDFGTYSGNRLANGGLPPTIPGVSDRPFESPSFYLAGLGGNTVISYTGQDCGNLCPIRPVPGDILLYRNAAGQYSHVAKIAENGVRDNGDGTFTVTEVISKWGREGLYKHDPDDGYGHDWTVWHTNRGSSLLREVNGKFVTDANYEIVPDFAVTPLSIDETIKKINDACPGLYELLEKLAPPSAQYDCFGYVFANSQIRIPVTAHWPFNVNQIEKIRIDNGYSCKVPALHTGGRGCQKPLTQRSTQ